MSETAPTDTPPPSRKKLDEVIRFVETRLSEPAGEDAALNPMIAKQRKALVAFLQDMPSDQEFDALMVRIQNLADIRANAAEKGDDFSMRRAYGVALNKSDIALLEKHFGGMVREQTEKPPLRQAGPAESSSIPLVDRAVDIFLLRPMDNHIDRQDAKAHREYLAALEQKGGAFADALPPPREARKTRRQVLHAATGGAVALGVPAAMVAGLYPGYKVFSAAEDESKVLADAGREEQEGEAALPKIIRRDEDVLRHLVDAQEGDRYVFNNTTRNAAQKLLSAREKIKGVEERLDAVNSEVKRDNDAFMIGGGVAMLTLVGMAAVFVNDELYAAAHAGRFKKGEQARESALTAISHLLSQDLTAAAQALQLRSDEPPQQRAVGG